MAKLARPTRDEFDVVLDAPELGAAQRVGVLRRDQTLTDLPASFEYDPEWLSGAHRFMLDPRLELWKGEQHPPRDRPAFGILLDSAPDRWGRVLLERREAVVARRAERKVRTLQDVDFLLGVHDLTRVGALRFRPTAGGAFLDNGKELPAPPATSLRQLARISQRIEEPGAEKLQEYERWLSTLIAPGSSLGGARPKANFVEPDGRLWIAKFPAREDRHDVGAWEFLVHRLARKAGLQVPASRLEKLTDRYSTFCVQRFDRTEGGRRMFASAMTLLERRDGEGGGSYLDLAELISDQGAQGGIEADLAELFRRVVFNVLVGNRDDQLRNHGFTRTPTGWRLSPPFDMNPSPRKAEHALTLAGEVSTPDVDAVISTAGWYRLDERAGRKVVAVVHAAVATWKTEAKRLAIPRSEVQLMEAVFRG